VLPNSIRPFWKKGGVQIRRSIGMVGDPGKVNSAYLIVPEWDAGVGDWYEIGICGGPQSPEGELAAGPPVCAVSVAIRVLG
jgi:hypothetical protein